MRRALGQLEDALSAEVWGYVLEQQPGEAAVVVRATEEGASADKGAVEERRRFETPTLTALASCAATEGRTITAVSGETADGAEAVDQAHVVCVPLLGSRAAHGAMVVLFSEEEPASEQIELVEAFAAQISLALDREQLAGEHERVRLEAEGERLKSDLLRSISHDLRTPLSGITGAASTLASEEEEPDSATRREPARSIHQESTWLSQVVENLLNLTRLEGHSLRTRLPDEVLVAPMDGNLMEQVLVNLIDNAVKHTPPGTVITLDVCKEGGELRFTVRDNGPGIRQEILPHLFERFTSGRRGADSRRGVGLGLAICKTIVEAHEGSITAASRPEGGAEFCATIPIGTDDG